MSAPNHAWARRTADELARFDDETASINLARCYLSLLNHYRATLDMAHKLAKVSVKQASDLQPMEIGTKVMALEQLTVDAINAGIGEAEDYA